MPIKIGFAILSHSEPEQLLRLTRTLNVMFGDPPIVCHHDFGKCRLDERSFPGNVRFVRPHLVTGWGDIAVPLAAIKAFGLLVEYAKPDWFVLLSGSDYPVRNASEIVSEFSNASCDVYMDNREIISPELPTGSAEFGYDRPAWIPLVYERYYTWRFWWPRPSKRLFLAGRFPFQKRYVPIRNHRFNLFMRKFQADRPPAIYAGDFWFQANEKAVMRLLDDRLMGKIVRYFESRGNSEEAIFQTALCGQTDLRICKEHKRYADWSRLEKHPKWLEVSDVPKIIASGALFARKFRPDGLVQDYLDETVLGLRT